MPSRPPDERERARRAALVAARRRRRHSWFDAVAVERALRDWRQGEPLTSPGRPLSRRERRVVVHALLAVGETLNGVARHLRLSGTVLTELCEEPPPGPARAVHREHVRSAVVLLERLGARRYLALRRSVVTKAEADRIVGLSIGRGELPDQIFNPRFVSPR